MAFHCLQDTTKNAHSLRSFFVIGDTEKFNITFFTPKIYQAARITKKASWHFFKCEKSKIEIKKNNLKIIKKKLKKKKIKKIIKPQPKGDYSPCWLFI